MLPSTKYIALFSVRPTKELNIYLKQIQTNVSLINIINYLNKNMRQLDTRDIKIQLLYRHTCQPCTINAWKTYVLVGYFN